MRLIVAITGASGVIYGKRLLEVLKENKIETYLIISKASKEIIKHELGMNVDDLRRLANYFYEEDDFSSPLASGSFITDGMIIIPCSTKTFSGIAHGYSENLILRAAEVTLKEKRKLILVPRETPLNLIHLRNLLELAILGAIIIPAMPAFYHKPEKINDLVDFVIGKVLDCIGIKHSLFKRWCRWYE